MRFVLVGNGFPATKLLEMLLADARAETAGVFTSDEGSGRLQTLCRAQGLEPIDAATLNSTEGLTRLRGLAPDWILNANSTVLLREDALTAAARGALNLHPGLLPEYAGLHTHQWAIRNGEREFGVTVHWMEPRLDTGPIVAVRRFPITERDTGLSLFTRCIQEGGRAMADVLGAILDGRSLPAVPQDLTRRHLYRRRDAVDGRIDWTWTARQVVDFVRAGNYEPFEPPSYTAELDATHAHTPGPRLLVARRLTDPPAAQADPAERAPEARPGSLLGFVDDQPVLACGSGEAVALVTARVGKHALVRADWEAYFDSLSERGRLAGRRTAQEGS